MAISRVYGRIDTHVGVSGANVTLRRPHANDYQEWTRLRAKSQEFLSPWEPSWANDELSQAAYRRRMRRYAREVRDGVSAPFFVFRHTDSALVGGCNLTNIRRGVSQACSLGYWVGESHQRRGYILDAARTVVRHAFGTLDLHRVEAACIPSNGPSRALLEKLGFREEGLARAYLKIDGVWCDHVLYAIVRETDVEGDGAVTCVTV